VTKLFQRRRSVEAVAPSTISLREMVPSPAIAGADKTRAFSRRVFLRPSFAKPLHESVCLQKNKGRRSADRRNGRIRTGTSDERIRTAGQCGARHGWSALPRASACGRARLSALRRGTFQLRAALPGNLRRLTLSQTPLLASSSRTGRSAGEAGSEAARERSAKPRAGTAARSTNRIASR